MKEETKENVFTKAISKIGGFFKAVGNFIAQKAIKLWKFIIAFVLSIPNRFKRLGINIGHGFMKILRATKKYFVSFGQRFKDGGIGTKLSHLFMGSGNFAHKQYVKGAIYLVVEILFFLFMILCPSVNKTPFGYKAIGNFFTLGNNPGDIMTPTDNSMLMLLFGVVTFGIIAIFFYCYNSNLKSAYKADLDVKEGKKPTTFKEDLSALVNDRFHIALLTPAIIGVVVFTVLPTIFMIMIAFTNYDADHQAGQTLIDWVGMDNFKSVFSGKGEISVRFFPVLGWTFTWAFFATFLNYFAGILLALLINKKTVRCKKLWRTVFIMTIALPQFISLLAVRNILSELGPFNAMLINLGILDKPMAFLGNAQSANIARTTIIIINLWIGIPYTMLMTSGILMNIPKDLYEAAEIDGATKWKMFIKITMPYVIFVTTPYLISAFIGNITSFNVIFLLSGGGPAFPGFRAGKTDLLVTWLYKLTIENSDYNIGAVIGIFTFIITSVLTLLLYRNSKAYKQEDTFQ